MNDIIEKLKRQFGVETVYRWSIYYDDRREKRVVEIIEAAALDVDIVPSLLATIAAGEGLGLWVLDTYAPDPPHDVMVGESIDGFMRLGLDHFTSDFNRARKYLPKSYNENDEFTPQRQRNEHGQAVSSAIFRDLKSGVQALAATLRLRRDTFQRDLAALGGEVAAAPNSEQEAFWIYVYFQGEGRAARYLAANGGVDYAKDPPKSVKEIRRLALERVAAWKFIQSKQIFTQ